MDRKGKCPNCGVSWKGEDILNHLSTMDVFINEPLEKVKEIANRAFGWKEDSPESFSEVIVHSKNGNTLYQCPNMKCMHIFDANTGEEYKSMTSFLLNITMKKDEQDNTDRDSIRTDSKNQGEET
jgi:hypothetical protein